MRALLSVAVLGLLAASAPVLAATARGTATVRIVRPTLLTVEPVSSDASDTRPEARIRVLSGNRLTGATVTAMPHPDASRSARSDGTKEASKDSALLVYHSN